MLTDFLYSDLFRWSGSAPKELSQKPEQSLFLTRWSYGVNCNENAHEK